MNKKIILIVAMVVLGIFGAIYFASRRTETEIPAAAGLAAKGIELQDASNGKTLSLSELRGKVLFINFWATWCDPCREEASSISALFKHFMDYKNFAMITILFRDDPQNAYSFLKEKGIFYPVMVDPEKKAARAFGLTGVPETFLIDKKGVIRKKVLGPYDWSSPEAMAFITELLKE